MRELFISGFLGLLLAMVLAASALAAEDAMHPDRYRLGTGDLVRIHVYGEDDLTIETRVGDRGSISYPFLGELSVAGLTVREVQDLVTRGLKGPYLIDPKVSVSIQEYRPFYVNGEVRDPGGYPFQPRLTVRKAVSLAGGFKERAARSKIFMIRDGDPERTRRRVTLEDPVNPGDIITVEQSFF